LTTISGIGRPPERGFPLYKSVLTCPLIWGAAQRLLLLKGPDWREEIEKLEPLLKKQLVAVERTIFSANPLSARPWVLVILWKTGWPR
jgi:hypothetical protein